MSGEGGVTFVTYIGRHDQEHLSLSLTPTKSELLFIPQTCNRVSTDAVTSLTAGEIIISVLYWQPFEFAHQKLLIKCQCFKTKQKFRLYLILEVHFRIGFSLLLGKHSAI